MLALAVAAQVAPPTPSNRSQTLDQAGNDQQKPKHGDVVSRRRRLRRRRSSNCSTRSPGCRSPPGSLRCSRCARGAAARRGARLPVIQTQIILAVVGAVVMLVVGSSLARAFGIVGAAGLVRYRAKIEDPKDAGVMLSTLAVGLASGVGLWLLAAFATVFILALLWIVESFEPKATQLFALKVKAKDPAAPEAEARGSC